MHFRYRNVNEAFVDLVEMFQTREGTIDKNSRNGRVRKYCEPVIVTFERPRERVLFGQARDCNPFFHLYESLWMLSGRDDLEPLTRYVSTFGDFSDDDRTLNGAYGYRWRDASVSDEVNNGQRVDQLNVLVEHLRQNPDSRRAVLQMWNVEDDLMKIGSPVSYSKDVCCNTNVYFSIHQTHDHEMPRTQEGYAPEPCQFLDMTVCNRSNDLIWGMLGANVVHFSMLQEYLAGRLGIEVGEYHQMSNDMHVYLDRFEPEKWLAEYHATLEDMHSTPKVPSYKDLEPSWRLESTDEELLDKAIRRAANPRFVIEEEELTGIPFLDCVVAPALKAFNQHLLRNYIWAEQICETIDAPDWRYVCTNWIRKRELSWKSKNGGV